MIKCCYERKSNRAVPGASAVWDEMGAMATVVSNCKTDPTDVIAA